MLSETACGLDVPKFRRSDLVTSSAQIHIIYIPVSACSHGSEKQQARAD